VHEVVVVALDGVVAADLATPAEVLGRTRLRDGTAPYRIRVAAPRVPVDAGLFTLRTRWRLDTLAEAHTVVVPGRAEPTLPTPPAVLRALRAAAANGTRIASICVGAFVLAEAGLLDGRRATTHWAAAGDLARMYPDIEVDPDVLFVDNGQILTSAGAAAGLDLCLHLVRRDHGSAIAADTARATVMPLERSGGQAQFINHVPPNPSGASLDPLLRWLDANHHRPLTLAQMAEHAAMSTRTLNRQFREQVGTTPIAWLRAVRIRRAQHLLETTDASVEALARLVGFGSTTTFRDHFTHLVGTTPTHYRHSFTSTLLRPIPAPMTEPKPTPEP
jgi:transcriptional regulator GlxA family with amidase domain